MCNVRAFISTAAPQRPTSLPEGAESVALWLEYYRQLDRYQVLVRDSLRERAVGCCDGGCAVATCVGAKGEFGCCRFMPDKFDASFEGDGDGARVCEVGGLGGDSVCEAGLQGSIDRSGDSESRVGGCVSGGDEDARNPGPSVQVGGGVTSKPTMRRGPNYERNCANRENKKRKKLAKQKARSMSGDAADCGNSGDGGVDKGDDTGVSRAQPAWRSRRVEEQQLGVGQRKGYFSECPVDVQAELRESRARMMIAENKRKEAEAIDRKKKLDSVTPEVALVSELIRVTRMANQLKKQTKDQVVGGWAETVADTLTRSTAESAPSSMPSLRSVEEGSSALKSDGVEAVFDQEREVRLAQYNVEKLRLDRYYDQVDGYGVEEHDNAYKQLKEAYSDVTKSEAERQNHACMLQIAASMQSAGMDQYKIQDIMEGAGFEYYA